MRKLNVLFLLLTGIPLVSSVQSQNELECKCLNDVNTDNKCCRDSINTARKTDSRFVLEEQHQHVHHRIKRSDNGMDGESIPHSGNEFNNDDKVKTQQSAPNSSKEGHKRPVICMKSKSSKEKKKHKSDDQNNKKRHIASSSDIKVRDGRGQWFKNFLEKRLLSEADNIKAAKRQAQDSKKPGKSQKDKTVGSEKPRRKYGWNEGDEEDRGQWYRKYLEEKDEIEKRNKGIHTPDNK